MATKNLNQLLTNLPQLQNVIKKDPETYKDEFLQQWSHFQSALEVFRLSPTSQSQEFEALITFLSQVSHCYPEELESLPEVFGQLLEAHHESMDSDLRMTLCKSLILLRNKGLVSPLSTLQLFFKMLRCKDKLLRKTLFVHIVSDIKNMNSKHKNNKINTALQNYMFSMLKDNHVVAARTSLDAMIELYRRNVWHDSKTVNVIVTACFSKVTKVMVTALNFFLGSDAEAEDASDSESEDDASSARHLVHASGVKKKNSKKKKKLEKALSLLRKSKKKTKPLTFNFSAMHLIHDPQGFAEKLFQQVESSTGKFEVKLMMLNLISRLIGIHELILLNFYPFIQRFLQPHQREVTKFLTYLAQACHQLVPPDAIEPAIRAIVNNFVTERNSFEVMSVGINAVREICNRCPLAMSPELLQDLALYKKAKNKGVIMATKSLIQLYRKVNPEILHRKDRGHPTQVSSDTKCTDYGELKAASFVPGTELLPDIEKEEEEDHDEDDLSDDDMSDGEWIDVSHSSDEGQSCDEEYSDEDKSLGDLQVLDSQGAQKSVSADSNLVSKAEHISSTRILTDRDFKVIEKQKIVTAVLGPSGKRKRKNKEVLPLPVPNSELVSESSILNLYKRPKQNKEERVASTKDGRDKKFKPEPKKKRYSEFASTTNKEKMKKKPFMMISHSKNARTKKKRSFREKQIALRDSLLKKQKLKQK